MARKNWSGCGCPANARKVSTKGRGRGWVCIAKKGKRPRFVKASCGR